MIKAILACDDYGGVSKKGTLPWPHNSTDLKMVQREHSRTCYCNGIYYLGRSGYAAAVT